MEDVKIDFTKMDGLVPGIVQDAKTGEMLMLVVSWLGGKLRENHLIKNSPRNLLVIVQRIHFDRGGDIAAVVRNRELILTLRSHGEERFAAALLAAHLVAANLVLNSH